MWHLIRFGANSSKLGRGGSRLLSVWGTMRRLGDILYQCRRIRLWHLRLLLPVQIGVFSGKAVLTGLWEKLGISWGRVEATPNALTDSAMRPFTKEEKSWIEKIGLYLRGLYIKISPSP